MSREEKKRSTRVEISIFSLGIIYLMDRVNAENRFISPDKKKERVPGTRFPTSNHLSVEISLL